MKNIKFIICGLEHSGTTLLSDVFRQVPELDSGFEVGVLLVDSPRKFKETQPFYDNVQGGWQIDKESLANACDTDDFNEFYQRLQSNSGALKNKSAKYIFDKTPRYFTKIISCYKKIKVPFIIMYKDPRALVYSDFKRVAQGTNFREWYTTYKEAKCSYLRQSYGRHLALKRTSDVELRRDVLCVSLEDICLNTRTTLDKVFQHVGYNLDLSYLLLKDLRYPHTRAPEVSSRIPFEYFEGLTKPQIAEIEKDFAEFEDWFYN